MDDSTILSFVLSHVPDEWEDVPEYTTRFVLFTLKKHSREYQTVQSYFNGAPIAVIQRIQNPFQFGRYMFRREILQTNYEVSGKNTSFSLSSPSTYSFLLNVNNFKIKNIFKISTYFFIEIFWFHNDR